MRKYYKALGRDPFEVLPLTFHIKSTSDPEYKNFLAMHKSYDQQREQAKFQEKELKSRVSILAKEIASIEETFEKLSKTNCEIESEEEEKTEESN